MKKILKEQLDKAEEIKAEKYRLYDEIKRLEEKVEELTWLERRVVNSAQRYKYQEIIPIICYLVSLVEGKNYTFGEREIPVAKYYGGDYGLIYLDLDNYDSSTFRNKYKVQYICSDEKAAKKEFDRKINEIHAMGARIYSEKPIPFIQDMVTKPAESYVQIAVFSDDEPKSHEPGDIYFDSNGYFLDRDTFLLLEKYSKICDPHFMYIVDFMNYLTVMKLETKDITLSTEEMMEYARDFAGEVRKEKNGNGKILEKVMVEISDYYCV